MAQKRKAVTRDSPEADEVALSDGGSDLGDILLNGNLADSSGEEPELEEDDGSEDGDDENGDLEDLPESVDDDEEEEEEEDGFGEFEEETDLTDEDDDDGQLLAPKTKGLSQYESLLGDALAEENEGENKMPYTLTKDANGNMRFEYHEIDPVYDSDDSALEATNTIGNIPLSFYDAFPHVGYDIEGKKISRPAKGEALDTLLDTIEIPQGWTGLKDSTTGKDMLLSAEELQILKQIQRDEAPEGYDPYAPAMEWFTNKGNVEVMGLSSAPEPKRRFVPSKHGAKRIMKLVRLVREGKIKPWRPQEEEEEEDDVVTFDLWANEGPRNDHAMNLGPAPKPPPPTHELSIHPPPEYLPDDKERKEWEEADEEERRDVLPTDYDSLRKVPAYEGFVKERFNRALDLYLAPRVQRHKTDIDPDSLLPQLPSPEELKPYPTRTAIHFPHHSSLVRTCDVSPNGLWLATGSNDGVVRVWEVISGHLAFAVNLNPESRRTENSEMINVVRWRPTADGFILAVATGETLFFLIPPLCSPAIEAHSRELLSAGFGYATTSSSTSSTKKANSLGPWIRPNLPNSSSPTSPNASVLLSVALRRTIKSLSWHRSGDYCSSVSPDAHSKAIAIHRLSKHLTQFPFRLKNLPQCAVFDPIRPRFAVATQRNIHVYDLSRQMLIKTLNPGAKWISSMSVHSSGDLILAGSYDKRLLLHDLDLSQAPYKTLRYHQKAIRSVKFHTGFPLFADASDDSTVQIFHIGVGGSEISNASVVPLKILKGHKVHNQLGVLEVAWVPKRAFLITAAADGDARLWV